MATKTTSRVLVSTAIGALALGLTAPAASAHGGTRGGSNDDRNEHSRHQGHHRGHAWGHANIKSSRVVVDEGAGTATVTLRLNKKAPADATFTWTTFDKTPAPAPSTEQRRSGGKWSDHLAVAGQDYTASSGTVTIAAGTRTATVTVPILDDTAVEKKERFFVRFKATSATKAAARKASKREGTSRAWCSGSRGRATATVVITDDDTTAPTS